MDFERILKTHYFLFISSVVHQILFYYFQALFTMDPSEHGRRLFNMGTTVNGNEAMEKPHTLEDYAIDHFRPPPKVRFILL